jgi:hypothetical protein
MEIRVKVADREWSVESDDLSEYMLGRVLRYGLKQALQDSYAGVESKAERLECVESRYQVILNDDRDGWGEGAGGGKLDEHVAEMRRLAKIRHDGLDTKPFKTVIVRDKALVAGIESFYNWMAAAVVCKITGTDISRWEAHRDEVTELATAWYSQDSETATANLVKAKKPVKDTALAAVMAKLATKA